MEIIAAFPVVFVALALVLVKLTRHFASPHQHLPVTVEWIDELSIERYRPMVDLLNQEDIHFLRTQPGFTRKMATKLRIQRCQLFQEYLGQLDKDFKRICMALKLLMVQAKHDRPDLASVLLQSQMTFACGMMMAEFRLACYRFGIGTVNVSGLLNLFDDMRLELRTLIPAESYQRA